MDRRSRCARSLRGLAVESIRAEPETLARLETPLLGHRSAPECRLRPDLLGYLRLDTGLSVGPNHCCHLLEGLDREHGTHLSVARLVAPQARDRPELGEQAGPAAVDGELSAIEPFDVPVAARDDGESFSVGLDPEPMRLGKRAELLNGALLFG